ncbi:putative secreted protein (type I secretion substrate), partial [Acinetobacter calcoaceticus]
NGANGVAGKSAYEVAVDNGYTGTEQQWLTSLVGRNGTNGIDGAAGKSAYQIAVINGFVGDESAWLLSLVGAKGDQGEKGETGLSAYDLAVKEGFVGTITEWLQSQKGQDGSDGKDGVNGKSAYELAVDKGYTGSEDEWLLTLVGQDGINGTDGKNGANGANGVAGKSAYEVAVDNGYTGTEQQWLTSLVGSNGTNGIDGAAGKSAYEIAVINGFVGDESAWLLSLVGAKGDQGEKGETGLSAYDLAVKEGFVGTITEWLQSQKGQDGSDGKDGVNGKSAYELAVDKGYTGSEDEWLLTLVGQDGINGTDGKNGANGANGVAGKSAYEIAVDNGYTGTEQQWLTSLVGSNGTNGIDGAAGKSAYEIAVINGFVGDESAWLLSLVGAKGDQGEKGETGLSAYDLAVKEGFVGTITEWLQSQKGQDGSDGKDGVNGKSAYELAVDKGYTGSEDEWLLTLVGQDGINGTDGKNGANGANGVAGKSAYEIAVDNGYTGTEQQWLTSLVGRNGTNGIDGAAGKSAYQIAVINGFVGDESAWLLSLVGAKGDQGEKGETGLSAYDLAVKEGFVGTITEWLQSQKGQDGSDGKDGVNGKSAYELAVDKGYTGSEDEWLLTLVGQDGINGTDGKNGANGANGVAGKSAYEIAVENGYTGTEQQWLTSLVGSNGTKGIDGAAGKSAYQIAVINGFVGDESAWLLSLVGAKGDQGEKGETGLSAYDLAVKEGFVGTITEWLQSQKGQDGSDGKDGVNGKSAYELAVDKGYTGSEDEWLLTLVGQDGINGTDGKNGANGADGVAGKSAYEIAVENGYTGTEQQWLTSLVGSNGTNGIDGAAGKSAYEIAVINGFVGDESAWLLSLVGAKGDQGEKGETGLSAYDLAVKEGFVGSITEWLQSLEGKDAYTLEKPVIVVNADDELSGTAKAGEKVVILNGSGHIIAEQVVKADGTFSFSPNPLKDSIGSIYVTNDQGELSDSFTLVGAHDTTAPDIPVIEANDQNSLSGTAEPNSLVVLTVNGKQYSAQTDASGQWSFSPNPFVVENVAAGILHAQDAAGNKSNPVLVFKPVDSSPADILDSVTVLNDLNADDIINGSELGSDQKVQVLIKLGPDANVGTVISVNGDKYVLNNTDIAKGSITVKVPVREGENALNITAETASGQTDRLDSIINVNTDAGDVTVTHIVPESSLSINDTVHKDMIINASEATGTVVIVGQAAANATVQVTIAGVAQPWTVQADANGKWSIDLSSADIALLPEGSINIQVKATDTSGNSTAAIDNSAITIDREGPELKLTVEIDGTIRVDSLDTLYTKTSAAASLDDVAAALTSTTAGSFVVIDGRIKFVPQDDKFYGEIEVSLADGQLTDLAGNLNKTDSGSSTGKGLVDTAPVPDVVITSSEYNLLADETAVIKFTFSELITGFALEDIVVTGGTLGQLLQDPNNPLLYTAVFTPDVSNNLTANISVLADSYESATTGKLGKAGQLDQLITGDTLKPNSPFDVELNDDGNLVTGKADAGSIIVITNTAGVEIGRGIVENDGSFSVAVNPALTDGAIGHVSAQDDAGNKSASKDVIGLKDTIPPMTPILDAFDGVILTGTTEANAKVNITVGGQTVEVTADGQGRFSYNFNPTLINVEEVKVTATDAAGNTSAEAKTNAPDLTAPDAPLAELDSDNAVLSVETEPNAIVKVYDSAGNLLAEGPADANGHFSYTFDPALERGKILDITATDAAGNTSEKTTIRAGINDLFAAADNHVDILVLAEPKQIKNNNPSALDKGGFSVAKVGLGPVLELGVLDDIVKNSVQIEVGKDQVRNITVKGDATGITLGGTMDLYLYKFNESSQEWEQYAAKENWVVAWILAGVSKPTDFSLTEGKWMFVMSSGEGVQVLTKYTLKFSKDIVLDYGLADSVSGSASGNMLTDDDPIYGQDQLPPNSTLLTVNGIDISSNAPTVIHGLHGKLVVKTDGSYTYTVNDSFRGYGEKDVFTYKVTSPSGEVHEADLTFELDITAPESRLPIDNTVIMDAETIGVPKIPTDIPNSGSFSVLDLGLLGPILDANLIGSDGVMTFNVGENQVRELSFHGTGGSLLSLSTTFDLVIFKLDPKSGQLVQVHKSDKWFHIPLDLLGLGGAAMPKGDITLQFGEGTYVAMLQGKSSLGLVNGSNLSIQKDVIYDYDKPTEYKGTVSGDSTLDPNTILLQVKANGIVKDVEPGAVTKIKGQYGELLINADGSYTYNVSKPANAPADWKPAYGKIDSFQIVTQDSHGKTIIDHLNIEIGTHSANDDFADLKMINKNVQSSIEFHESDGALSNYGKSYSKEFDIQANQVGTESKLAVKGSSEGGLLGLGKKPFEISYTLLNTTTGKLYSGKSANAIDANLSAIDFNLPAGHYKLTITTPKEGNIEQIDYVNNILTLDSYAESVTSVTGSLLVNDLGAKNLDSISIDGKIISISDPNKGVKSFDIVGQFGTLTVNKDGTYSYKAKGGVYGTEYFSYETTSKVGLIETAVLEINVGKQVTASAYADQATGSVANDSFTMGASADTVIYNVLDNSIANAGGNAGNGVDKWTDFNASEGDKIDISKLLDGNQTADNIHDYVSYEDGMLKIDRNGQADYSGQPEGKSNYVDLISINTDKTLDELLNNNNIVWH